MPHRVSLWLPWLRRMIWPASSVGFLSKAMLLVLLGLVLAIWDDNSISLFLAVLVPVHVTATAAFADSVSIGLRPYVWSAARMALLVPAVVGIL